MDKTTQYYYFSIPLDASRTGKGYTKHYFAGTERILANVSGGGQPLVPVDTELKSVEGDSNDLSKNYTAFAAGYFVNVNENSCENNGIELPAEVKNIPNLHSVFKGTLGAVGGDKLYYFNANHSGSGSMITDSKGNPYQTIIYDPFGEILLDIKNGSYDEQYKFGGKMKDEESGLYYANARYYDPRISQFLSVDNLAEQAPHQSGYAYCSNNPVRYVDPTGKFVMSAELQKAYPQLTTYMKRIASELAGKSEQFKNALMESSGLSGKQITNILTFGKGPELKVENLDTESVEINGNTDVQVVKTGKKITMKSGSVSLDNDVVNMLENAQTIIDKTAGRIMVESTILHETTHVGNALTSMNGNGNFQESGKNFEVKAYGMDIDRSNVKKFAEGVALTPLPVPAIKVAPVIIPEEIKFR